MSTYQLSQSYATTLNGSGAATVSKVGPVRYRESWHVTLFSCSAGNPCKLTVYRGPAGGRQIDYTSKGLGDTSTRDDTLRAGEYLTFVWSGGTAGDSVSVTVEGEDIYDGVY